MEDEKPKFPPLQELREPFLLPESIGIAIIFVVLMVIAVACERTPEETCNMDTPETLRPADASGEVTIKWVTGVPELVASTCAGTNPYGCTECFDRADGTRLCLVRMAAKPPQFRDICALARFGHEFDHAIGATHIVKDGAAP